MTPVWLHGWPLDERMWDRQVAAFGGVAVRLYGRGNSIDGWAAQLLDELPGGDLALVGSSMGGYAALAVAQRAPERVAAIVLSASKAAPDTPERREAREGLIERLRTEGPPENAAGGVGIEELIACQEAIRDRADLTGVVTSFRGVFAACAGTEDEIVRTEDAFELAGLAEDGRPYVFPGAGHFLNLDQPDAFDAMIAESLTL
jgi:pimeloyl-ACP methyl ester carboxylesterase